MRVLIEELPDGMNVVRGFEGMSLVFLYWTPSASKAKKVKAFMEGM